MSPINSCDGIEHHPFIKTTFKLELDFADISQNEVPTDSIDFSNWNLQGNPGTTICCGAARMQLPSKLERLPGLWFKWGNIQKRMPSSLCSTVISRFLVFYIPSRGVTFMTLLT